jgi:YlmC/YmxH family sporulation protein
LFIITISRAIEKGVLVMKEKREEKNILPLSELRQMEVIDIYEGRRLGFISDIIFDDDFKRIEYLVITPQSSVFSIFRKKEEVVIKWSHIKVIGIDILLIDTDDKRGNIAEFTSSL